jgi:hypothetical protein
LPKDGADPSQNFVLYEENGNQVVHGATPVATLWAAYELIESWGVGFYLGGDTLPALDPQRRVKMVEAVFKPALAIRGSLPWCNFADSPTSWNPQDYRTFLEQMSRQKANFIGFHSYDQEPFASWFPNASTAAAGHPLMTATNKYQRHWSPPPWGAGNGLFGTDQFFDRDDWGSEVGAGMEMTQAVRAQQQMMIDALRYAHDELGMKACMGFEVSGDSADPKLSANFINRLKHVLEVYPLDYLWIWQPEAGSTHHKERKPESELPEEVRQNFDYLDRSVHDLNEASRMLGWLRLAFKTIQEYKPAVKLVVSGWGGEQYLKFSDYYPGLDKVLPKEVIFSALEQIDPLHLEKQPEWSKEWYGRMKSKNKSTYPVRPGSYISSAYGQLSPERQRWPILWFESDGYRNGDQTMPQPNVNAFAPALSDALAKGCQGVLGIHWRTRNVRDVAGYTWRFGWDSSLTPERYFGRYARDFYGPELAASMAEIHAKLEAFGSTYAGHSGTMECAKDFKWFQSWFGVPEMPRLQELRTLQAGLQSKAAGPEAAAWPSAAMELGDLADTLQWVTGATETGLAIAPACGYIKIGSLNQRLLAAEGLAKKGDQEKAKAEAVAIAAEVTKLPFPQALTAVARTSRTRGELGMLLTANQRYGRYYAEFVDRLRKLSGDASLLTYKTPWSSGEVHNSFPVPNQTAVGQAVNFDAVLIPARASSVELMPSGGGETLRLPLKLMGGAYHRASFTPTNPGAWSWRLVPDKQTKPGERPWASGVLNVVGVVGMAGMGEIQNDPPLPPAMKDNPFKDKQTPLVEAGLSGPVTLRVE